MILKASHIHKSYHNGEKELSVLRDINIELESGDMITIMGQSGAGKTTLLNILGTLDSPDRGIVEIGGQDIAELNEQDLSELRNQKLGFVFQFHHLLPEFNAGNENELRSRAEELFDYVNMSERSTHYPHQLSGGERLRVAVLRAIICEPEIVLADEPTGNLDVHNADRLLKLFQQINKDLGQAFVITTHNPDVSKIGHRSYKLENETLIPTDSI